MTVEQAGMETRKWMAQADGAMATTYKRTPVVFSRGIGCTLWDTEGRSYLDFVAGIAVCNLGHAHPAVSKALCEQSKILVHVSNLYYTMPQTELAAWLVDHSFGDRVFFCNSGAEANEAAIKLARKYFKDKAEPDRYRIISMVQSFHGRTLGTLSATGQDKIKQGFSPILEGFDFVPFNDIQAIREKISASTCAILLEPVQGEGGIRIADPEFLQAVRRLCDETGTLLIFDEIQTGIGRTGKLFAYEHFGVEPDIMTLAKALANGLPIGAMVAKDSVAAAFVPGSHASTFGGTPLVAAASLSVLKTLEQENIIGHCAEMGRYFKEQLLELKSRHDAVADIRGLGLLLGMELNTDGLALVQACMEKGFVINCVQGNILRFVPPLIVKKAEIDQLIHCLDKIL
jgi:acetylornithine/N-succinyldiaminopimelate aminotransferase